MPHITQGWNLVNMPTNAQPGTCSTQDTLASADRSLPEGREVIYLFLGQGGTSQMPVHGTVHCKSYKCNLASLLFEISCDRLNAPGMDTAFFLVRLSDHSLGTPYET